VYVAVDFETTAILPRPEYPPVPVGAAILVEGSEPEYLAWGHPTENNTNRDFAHGRLAALWHKPKYELIFHNAAFDLDVAREHFHLPLPAWDRVHDTQMMAFLVEPENPVTQLKVIANEHLGMPPEEQDDLFDWIRANVPEARRKKNVGAYISKAPGGLVGKYAIGDVVRTLALFHHFYDWLRQYDVWPAYERERRLLPALLDMERAGVRIDEEGIASALQESERGLEVAGEWLKQTLRGAVNLNSGDELADRLETLGWVKEHEWHRTWKGHRQTSIPSLKAVLPAHCQDFLDVYRYYSMLSTVLRFQLRPWSKAEGRIYCHWNSTRRSQADGRSKGARTGRLSSTPNFQNIPRRIPRLCTDWAEKQALESRGIETVCLADRPLRECAPIPHPREFILPSEGHLFTVRDFSQQELRILAHFAGGPLSEAYNTDPHLDMHNFAREKIHRGYGLDIPRGDIKGIGFGVIYGQSIGGTAALLGLPFEQAKEYREAYFRALGTVDQLIYKKLKCRAAEDRPFRTWGGRLYWCEEPKLIDGEIRTFEYKMLNTLIQGSAGDHIKEVMVNASEADWPGRVVLTVHDEVVAEAPREEIAEADRRLDEIMVGPQFAVPMVTDGKIGENWEVCK
jgi:DNA polymerase-1